MKHSPIPWTAACEDDDSDTNGDAIYDARGCLIARVEAGDIREKLCPGVEPPGCTAGSDSLDEADDIARLIVRAVNSHQAMVGACRAAVEYAETCGDYPENTSGRCIGLDHLAAMKAALALADCRQQE